MKKSGYQNKKKSWGQHVYWLFLVTAAVGTLLSLYALRQNNLKALKLRDEVLTADRVGGNTEVALRNLRQFIYSHMNTNLTSGPNSIKPPIQLKYRYEKLVAAQKTRVDGLSAEFVKTGTAKCRAEVGSTRVQDGFQACLGSYLLVHSVKEQVIPDSLYKFDFVSPVWSPDLAGWSLVTSGLSLILFLSCYLSEKWLRHNLRSHL